MPLVLMSVSVVAGTVPEFNLDRRLSADPVHPPSIWRATDSHDALAAADNLRVGNVQHSMQDRQQMRWEFVRREHDHADSDGRIVCEEDGHRRHHRAF